MDKISGILPPTPRSAPKRTSSDTPVRPGAPAFGRPEGSVEIRDRVSISSLTDPNLEMRPYKNPRDAQHVKIAESVTRKFFSTPDPDKTELESKVEPTSVPEFQNDKYQSHLLDKEY